MSNLEPGKLYKIRHKSASQRLERESVMKYLGRSENGYTFDARPMAGTQHLPFTWVLWTEEVPKGTSIYVNRVIGGSGK